MTMGFYVPTNNDVKFPKACEHCHFYDGLLCCVLDTYIHDPENKQEDCPLVPIQPHGRLIDADKIGLTDFEIILCQKGNPFKNALEMLLEKIENAPTVIPASEEGE